MMESELTRIRQLEGRVAELQEQLAQAREALDAIQSGAVDAVVVNRSGDPRVFLLSGSDEPYRVMIEEIQEGALIIDDQGVILYCNRQMTHLLHLLPTDLLGRSLADFLTVEQSSPLDILVPGEGRDICRREMFLMAADGSRTPALITSRRLLFDDTERVSVIVTDLSEQKKLEALRCAKEVAEASEKRLKEVFDTIPNMLWGAFNDGHIDFCNLSWCRYTGLSEDEIRGAGWKSVLHPEDILPTSNAWIEATSGGNQYEVEHRLRHHSGNYRWFLTRALPVRDPSGRVVRWFGNHTDIDASKRSEEALRQSEKRLRESERIYRAIGESIDFGVWVCDASGKNIYASDSFLRLVGQTQKECSEFGWREVLHPDAAERTLEAWKKCVQEEGVWDIEHLFRGADGGWHPVLARGIPVRDDEGKVIYWAGINLDIAGIKAAQDELRWAKDAAEDANRSKSRFLAAMSHDLRTPLNAIIGFSDLVLIDTRENELSPQQRGLIQQIADAGRHLLNIIEGLLNLSAIEAGKITLHREALDFKAMLENLAKAFDILAGKHGIRIELDIRGSDTIWVDRHRLWEILNNLVSNAIKYTPEHGSITIGAYHADGGVTIFVKDTGIGIDPADLDRIFFPFAQGKYPGLYDKSKSVGLGLAICHQLVQLHGGRIWFESVKGEGSCFSFTIPMEAGSPMVQG